MQPWQGNRRQQNWSRLQLGEQRAFTKRPEKPIKADRYLRQPNGPNEIIIRINRPIVVASSAFILRNKCHRLDDNDTGSLKPKLLLQKNVCVSRAKTLMIDLHELLVYLSVSLRNGRPGFMGIISFIVATERISFLPGDKSTICFGPSKFSCTKNADYNL